MVGTEKVECFPVFSVHANVWEILDKNVDSDLVVPLLWDLSVCFSDKISETPGVLGLHVECQRLPDSFRFILTSNTSQIKVLFFFFLLSPLWLLAF